MNNCAAKAALAACLWASIGAPAVQAHSWTNLGPGLDGAVHALAFDAAGALYAGGEFFAAGGIPARHVARWDGFAWSSLGSGLGHTVRALAFDAAGTLYAGGDFTTAGGVSVNRVARWDGTNWSDVGGGMRHGSFTPRVAALAADTNGLLYAGGLFDTAGGGAAVNVACWDGVRWSGVGGGVGSSTLWHYVSALAVAPGGRLYAGGEFSEAGAAPAARLACWDGSAWHAVGGGLDDGVYALLADAGNGLYVGGEFTSADGGGVAARYVAWWTGALWSSVGSGLGGPVYALARDAAGLLYAGGDFFTAGGAPANRLASWDGASWSPLGRGLSEWPGYHVKALAVDPPGNLYAGGLFITAGGNPATNIAKWKSGAFLPAPAGLAASKGTRPDAVRLCWDPVPDATRYEVWRSQAANSNTAARLVQTEGASFDDRTVALNATYYYWVKAGDATRTSGLSRPDAGYAASPGAAPLPLRDFDGDRLGDPFVYVESHGTWIVKLSGSGYARLELAGLLGGPGWTAAPADYDGDRLSDPAIYEEATGTWKLRPTLDGYERWTRPAILGGPGWTPTPEDYDGDKKADYAVYQEPTGTWSVDLSSARYARVTLAGFLGGPGFGPAAAHYDGDERADPAVCCRTGATWQVLLSEGNYTLLTAPDFMGGTGWIPVSADYDGDGRADPAVMNPVSGDWMVKLSGSGYAALTVPGFLGGVQPMPGLRSAR